MHGATFCPGFFRSLDTIFVSPRPHIGDPTNVNAHRGAHGSLCIDPLLVYTLSSTLRLLPTKVGSINMDKKSDDPHDLA
jgi:hypothetical protein